MKRFSAWLIGPLMLSTAGVAAMPAAARAAVPHGIAGTYTCFVNWNHVGYHKFPLTLKRDHTGTAESGYTVVWSRSGKSFEMTLNGVATYRGTKTKTGFNSKANPGLATTSGASGPWYAIKIG